MTRKRVLFLTSVAGLVVAIAVFLYLTTPRPIELRLRELNAGTDSTSWGPFQRLSDITNVHVDNDDFSDADLRSVATLRTLDSIDIESSRVTDAGIAALRQCPKTRMLRLHCPNLTNNGMEVLRGLPSLRALSVASDNITGDSINQFVVSTELWFLEMHGERVDDRACQRLRRFVHLESVDFSDSKVSDDGLALLAEHPGIIAVDVRWTAVTEEGVNRARQARPDLKIAWGDE